MHGGSGEIDDLTTGISDLALPVIPPTTQCGCEGDDYWIRIDAVLEAGEAIEGVGGLGGLGGLGGQSASGESTIFDRAPDPETVDCDATVGIVMEFGCGVPYTMAACDAEGACIHITQQRLLWTDAAGKVVLDWDGVPNPSPTNGFSLRADKSYEYPRFEFSASTGQHVVGAYSQCRKNYYLCR